VNNFAEAVMQAIRSIDALNAPASPAPPAPAPAASTPPPAATPTPSVPSVTRPLSKGWQAPPNIGGSRAASPSGSFQQYEDYYNRLQGVPTSYSAPAPVQQAAPAPAPAPAQSSPTFGSADIQQIADVLGKLFKFAQGGQVNGISGALPQHYQHRD